MEASLLGHGKLVLLLLDLLPPLLPLLPPPPPLLVEAVYNVYIQHTLIIYLTHITCVYIRAYTCDTCMYACTCIILHVHKVGFSEDATCHK